VLDEAHAVDQVVSTGELAYSGVLIIIIMIIIIIIIIII
jgi:hypothetical protein